MKKRTSLYALLICTIMILVSCSPDESSGNLLDQGQLKIEGTEVSEEPGQDQAVNESQEENSIDEEDDPIPPVTENLIEGKFTDEDLPLSEEEKQLVLEYFDTFYTSQMELEVQDMTNLFVSGQDNLFARLHQEVWRYMVEVRRMQATNMRLVSNRYEIQNVRRFARNENEWADSDTFSLTVNSFKVFAQHPDTVSEEYDVIHYFSFEDTEEGLKIRQHMQRGTLYWNVLGDYYRELFMENGLDIYDLSHVDEFSDTIDDMLAKAKDNIDSRTQGDLVIPAFDQEYRRQAAIDYADQWVNIRNDLWFAYDSYGGNCQNFVSQSLLAGGIPMDTSGSKWKWFGTEVNTSSSESGRTPSWTGVDYFVDYARDNSGLGLVATVDAPFDSGDIGDVVVLGYDEDWRHSLLISDVVRDEDGQVIDYLVVSNTSNLRNYPLSAYLYTNQMLIKIHGWNGEPVDEPVDESQIEQEKLEETTSENIQEESRMILQVGETKLIANLADNSSAQALVEMLKEGPVTIDMADYGSMEKVGGLGRTLPRNDTQITTEAGDLILYQGNAFVIYYAPNSWNFTRLGKIEGYTGQELKEILGNGNVTVVLSLED